MVFTKGDIPHSLWPDSHFYTSHDSRGYFLLKISKQMTPKVLGSMPFLWPQKFHQVLEIGYKLWISYYWPILVPVPFFIITLYEHFKRYFMDLVKHLWSKGWVYITWLAVTIWSLHYSACFMDHDIKGLVLCSVTMMEDIFRPKIFFSRAEARALPWKRPWHCSCLPCCNWPFR